MIERAMFMSSRSRAVGVLGWFAGVVGLAIVTALLAYHTSPIIVLGAFGAVAVVALVFYEPVAGIVLGLLLVPAETLSTSVGGAFALTPAKTVLLLTGAACAIRFVFDRTTFEVHRAHLAFAAFLLAVAAGLTVAVHTLVTVKTLVDWTAFLCISIYVSRLDRKRVMLIIQVLVLSAGVLGAIEIATTGNQTLVDAGANVVNRGTAAFSNANLLSFYLVLALGPAIVLATRSFRLMSAVFGGAVVLIAVGIVLSLTRSAIFGMVVVLLVMLWWAPFRRLGVLVIAVLLVVAIADPHAYTRSRELNLVSTRVATVEHFSSTSGDRLRIWSTAEHIIVDHPIIGIGEGNFPVVSSTRYGLVETDIEPVGSFVHAHDVLLTIAAETGLIGLALFAWFVVEVVAAGVKAISRWRGRPEFGLAIGISASLLGEAVVSTVDYPINNDVVMATTMLSIGLLIAVSRWPQPAAGRTMT